MATVEQLESRQMFDASPISGTVLYRFADHGTTVDRPLTNWTVYADVNQNGQLDSDEPYAVTNIDGSWTLSNLPEFPVWIREQTKSDWSRDAATPDVAVDPTVGTAQITFVNEMSAPTVVDVLAVFTPAAKAAAAVQGFDVVDDIQSQIDDADQVAANSDTNLRFNLVTSAEVNYHETGSATTDLNRLSAGSGTLSTVAKLRNQWAADLVVLYTDFGKSHDDVIGEGFEYEPGKRASTFGYSVVTNYKTTSNLYTMAHELGHNLGADHDLANAVPGAPYAFAHGYDFVGEDGLNYQDVMSYGDGIVLPIYSSPGFNYAGHAAGDGTDNNALAVEETAPIVAAYRQASGRATHAAATLAFSGVTLAKRSAVGGDVGNVTLKLRNTGNAKFSGPATIHLLFSTDGTVDAGDTALGDVTVPNLLLNASATKTIRGKFTFPTALADGTYRVLAEIEPTANAAVVSMATTPLSYRHAFVALQARSLSAPRTARHGSTLSVKLNLFNSGSIRDVESANVQFFASTDSTLDANDTLLLTLPGLPVNLPAGKLASMSRRIPIPALTPAGNYYLIALVDAPSLGGVTQTVDSLPIKVA